ncbi:PREDICTED: beta-2 adrenergic receptor-like isoform X1 [Papilio xuthus]|uniref:Beta-2 adrenergic receptor-like isoform X1 n=1 Tax=Papilio xuthus TaxID=66420 RepID=A0AAJ7E8N5_PAPXU|nr:PREDICTED: beta-2 adrenergic receptor-like isoform X1 [Papilio xuthus]
MSAVITRGPVTMSWCVFAATAVVITLTTVVANVVALLALWRVSRVPSHYPLMSLVTADLLVGTTVMPIGGARELFVFHLDKTLCSIWSTLDVLGCTASILSLCALGWERYRAVTSPLAQRRDSAKYLAMLVWPVATIVALLTAFIPTTEHHDPGKAQKACTVNINVGYVFGSIMLSFYTPAVVMIVFYTKIIRSLAAPPPIRAHRGRSPVPEVTSIDVRQLPNLNMLTRAAALIPPDAILDNFSVRQRRATMTILKLMTLFLVCWTPFFVMLPTDALCTCVSDSVWMLCTWLGYMNSAINPMVYAVASPRVRKALLGSHTSTTQTER